MRFIKSAMPELPEVEMVARSLGPLVGRRITRVETSRLALRQPVDFAALQKYAVGTEIRTITRRGKYLLIELATGATLVSHLGMTGRFLFAAVADQRPPHTHAAFLLDDGRELRFVDPRRFGVLLVARPRRLHEIAELATLGPEPLGDEFTLGHLRAKLSGSRRDLKAFLLDQTNVAGLGNIYACEALFVAGISPRRRADRVGPKRVERLHEAIRRVLADGIAHRGTSFSDYVDADGQRGDNLAHLWVYGREAQPCRRCKSKIRRFVQQARSTFYCPACQK